MTVRTILDVVIANPLIWQGTLWLVIGLSLAQVFRASPARAHAVVAAALAGALISPLIHLGFGELGLTYLPRQIVALGDQWRTAAGAMPTVRLNANAILFMLSGLGVCAFVIRRLRSFRRAQQVIRNATAVSDERLLCALSDALARIRVSTEVILREDAVITTPSIWCWSKPAVILVPLRLADHWPTQRLVAMFAHELGHLARRDHLASLVADLAAAFMWWNPLVWFARGQVRRLSEQACDVFATPDGRDAAAYAECLLQLARGARLGLGLPIVSRRDHLASRLRAILTSREIQPHTGRLFVGLVSVSLLALILMLAPMQRAQGVEYRLAGQVRAGGAHVPDADNVFVRDPNASDAASSFPAQLPQNDSLVWISKD